MKRTTIVTLLLFSSVLTNNTFGSPENIGNHCKTGMFSDDTFKARTDHISIYERVFLLVHCEDLPKGSFTINTQWMDEEGKLHTERPHSFQVASKQDYSVTFKFIQMPKGTFKRMISGQDYEEYQYGKWSVLTFINSDQVNWDYFTITD